MRVLSMLVSFILAFALWLVPTSAEAAVDSGTYVPVASTRLLDTRTTSAVAPWARATFQAAGLNGVPIDASAVIVNVTVTGPSRSGYATVFPSGALIPPTASNLNFGAGQTIANHVTVKIGASGAVDIKNGSPGTVHFVVDLVGYYVGGDATSGGTFTAIDPIRHLDTRSALGVGTTTAVAPGGTVLLNVTGTGRGVPTGAAAVAMNVTVTAPTGSGHLTVYPSDGPRPVVSNLNFTRGLTIANAANVKLSSVGQLAFYNGSGGTVHIIADVAGWFSANTTADPGTYWPASPTRWMDTRDPALHPFEDGQPMAPGFCWWLQFADPGVVRAFVFNTTVTRPTRGGYLVVYEAEPLADFQVGPNPPGTSNINFSAGQTIANLVTVTVSDEGAITICNGSGGTTHVIMDFAGVYAEGPAPVSAAPTIAKARKFRMPAA